MAYTTIDDPSAYFHTQLYSGDGGGSNAITNDANAGDFKPDWLWIKERTADSSNTLVDSTRGAGNILLSDNTNAEASAPAVSSLNTDGFTLGSDGKTNEINQTYVAWQWKANGGTTASNTDGSITSTVQANTTAGFSVVTWTSNGSAGQTIGHGLGVAPDMVILKNRSAVEAWQVYHQSIGAGKFLMLDRTNAEAANTNIWSNTSPTSTLFYVGANTFSSNSDEIVMYCFAEKQGYSKFGSYTGNGNADGPFIYTGFKPAWVMFKKTSGADGWGIFDNKRGYQNATNPLDAYLQPNNSNAESGESDSIDFLSNGFKWRISSGFRNESGSTFIYMAFAESPLVGSDGTPTTAR